MSKKIKRIDFLKGYDVVIRKHALERYMERAGVSEAEAKATLETKFRNSRLSHLRADGSELRKEVGGTLNKRLTFVAKKKGRTFYVITCYLQGPRNNFWKQHNEEMRSRKYVKKQASYSTY